MICVPGVWECVCVCVCRDCTFESNYCLYKNKKCEWMKTTISSYQFFDCLLIDRWFDSHGLRQAKNLWPSSLNPNWNDRHWTRLMIDLTVRYQYIRPDAPNSLCVLYHLNISWACGVNEHELHSQHKKKYPEISNSAISNNFRFENWTAIEIMNSDNNEKHKVCTSLPLSKTPSHRNHVHFFFIGIFGIAAKNGWASRAVDSVFYQ